LAAEAGASPEVMDYVHAKTDAAKRLIKSLEQRQDVLLTVGRAIIEFQRDFLENRCRDNIKPMAVSQIAVLADLEETGASHSLSNKYIDTPFGVFELTCFFLS
jgi:RNA polymerase sigma-54 factor